MLAELVVMFGMVVPAAFAVRGTNTSSTHMAEQIGKGT
jgi:hypothetical protein